MCLTTINEDNMTTHVGYKLFMPTEPLRGIYMCDQTYPVNRWLSANTAPLLPYNAGFHLFETERDAKEYSKHCHLFHTVVRKVEYRLPMYVGEENLIKVIVAKEIRICSQDNK